jgi:hypothetical protein
MPDVLQGHRHKVALAKQSAEGTAATTAEYQIPIYGGLLLPVEERTDYEVAQGDAYRPGQFKSKAWGEGTIEFATFPQSIGRLLTGHFGLDTVSGAGDPRTHTITFNNAPHWNTLWVARPLTASTHEWDRFIDCLFRSVEIQYVSGQLLRARVDLLSKKARVKVSAPTITTTEVLDSAAQRYTWASPTLKLDLDATPAVTTITNIASFTLHFGFDGGTYEQTTELNPDYRDLGLWVVSMSAEILVQNWNEYYVAFFGSEAPSADTDQSGIVVRGAADLTLNIGPPTDANRLLQFQLPAMEFSITAPEPDISGKGLRATLTGRLQKPPSGEPVTAVLKNALSASYSA